MNRDNYGKARRLRREADPGKLSHPLWLTRDMAEFRTPQSHATRVARRQFGAISRPQLRECGWSDDMVDGRIGTLLDRRARGVFVMPGAPTTWQQTAMIAVLAGPPGTVASHMTAAALAGLCRAPTVPHVTIPRGRSGRFKPAIVHVGHVPPQDCVVNGVPCTTAARALVDCAGLLDRDGLADLVDTALSAGRTSVGAIQAALNRSSRGRGRAGPPLLRSILEDWAGPISPDSPAEVRLFRQLREWGYPPPERQVEIRDADGNVIAHGDVGWAAARIVLDYDGLRHHAARAWAHDEARHAAVERAGYLILHVDKVDLLPGERRLRDALAAIWVRRAA